jgi:hypothetical protein
MRPAAAGFWAAPGTRLDDPCSGATIAAFFPFLRGAALLLLGAMKLRVLLVIALLFSVAACDSPEKKKPKKDDMPDQSGDMNFTAFIGRLRKAVELHDMPMMVSMMTNNFGYRLEPPGEGEGVFQYWDQTNSWPALQSVLEQKFVPKGNFLVAPPQFASDPQYVGYRAGMTLVNGSWKFAYFVKE